MHLIQLLFWFVSADAGFEVREASEVAFRARLPWVGPVLVAGVRSGDAEVRFRCRRALAGSRFWSLVGAVAERPAAVATIFHAYGAHRAADGDAVGQRAAAAVGDLFGLPPAGKSDPFGPMHQHWVRCRPLRDTMRAALSRHETVVK